MNFKEFIDKTNITIQNNNKNEELLNRNNKFLRANLILKLLQNLSVYLKFFEFKNDIIFEKNDPFIIIDDLKFNLNHVFYLKKSGIPQISEINNTLSFLKNSISIPILYLTWVLVGENIVCFLLKNFLNQIYLV